MTNKELENKVNNLEQRIEVLKKENKQLSELLYRFLYKAKEIHPKFKEVK